MKNSVIAFGVLLLIVFLGSCVDVRAARLPAPSGAPHHPSTPADEGRPDAALRGAPFGPEASLRATSDAPTSSLGSALISGWAGWASPSHGPDYLATRFPRGTRVRICAASCLVMAVTDYGPDPRLRPVRVADIAVARWERVCGLSASRGVCLVTIETMPAIPQTDTE